MKTHLLVSVLALGLVLGGCNIYYADQATMRGKEAFSAAQEAEKHGDSQGAKYNYRKAQLEFATAAQEDPTGTDRHYNLASAYQELKEYGRAIAEYDRALQCYPGNGKAHSGKIDCLVKMKAPQKQLDEVVATAASIVLQPGRIYLTLAMAYYYAGRTAEVPAALEKAVKAAPSDPHVQVRAGRFYRALGDIDSAKKYLRIAYQLNPEEPDVAYELGILGERLPPVAGR